MSLERGAFQFSGSQGDMSWKPETPIKKLPEAEINRGI